MPRSQLSIHDLSFRYEGQDEALVEGLSLALGPGWTCILGPNGSGKTTFLALACGLAEPSSGAVETPSPAIYCAQRVDSPPVLTEDAIGRGTEAGLFRRFGIEDDWQLRWDSLSPGERKRRQLAWALSSSPALLALDEPTNHLDEDAKELLLGVLRGYRGIGLLVSHDRGFADELCERSLLAPGWKLYSLPPTEALEAEAAGSAAAKRRRDKALAEAERLRSRASSYGAEARRADPRRSKGDLDPHDHDGKSRRNLARLTGKDAVANRTMRRLADRAERAAKEASSIKVQGSRKTGITVPGAASRRDILASAGPGPLPLGPDRALIIPALSLGPLDRVWLRGPNGAGKSTLLRALAADARKRGQGLVYIPQETPETEGREILERVKDGGRTETARILSELYRLGSDPDRLLASVSPSPGEVRKLLFALAFARGTPCIIADEPTNHLDIASILALEAALAGYGAALLLASHDRSFALALCSREWRIEGGRLQAGAS